MSRVVLAAAALGIAVSNASTQGASLLLDFGPTMAGVSGTDDYRTYSPGHKTGAVTGLSWNSVGTSEPTTDRTFGFVYDDGTAASNVQVDLGGPATLDANLDVVTWNSQPRRSYSMAGGRVGIYGPTNSSAPTRDAIFSGAANYKNPVGARITGLPVGIYDVYVTARNIVNNADTTDVENVHAFAGAGGAFNAGSLDLAARTPESVVTTSTKGNTDNWVLNANYALVRVEINENSPDLFVATIGGTGSSDRRGFLNSIEIVAVPEPAATGALLAAGGLLLRRRRTPLGFWRK